MRQCLHNITYHAKHKIKNLNFRINKNDEIELCSGLVDSNGELIYENDVLKSILHKNSLFLVRFREGEFHGDVICSEWSINLNLNPMFTKQTFTIVPKKKNL